MDKKSKADRKKPNSKDHLDPASDFEENFKEKVKLLVRSLKAKERQRILARLDMYEKN